MTGLNVIDFGAVGNGVIDDTAAIQDCIDQAVLDERRVIIPAGTYLTTSTLVCEGPIEIAGEGPERTEILSSFGATGIRAGNTAVSAPHGLYLHDFTMRGSTSTGYPMIDVIQYGRKWVIERVHLDNGFGNRPGIRLYTAWVGSIRDCNFWKFGAEGVASTRAAIMVKPQRLDEEEPVTSNGPINSLLIDGCAFERVQTGIDLHDPNETGTSTTIYSVEIRNPRFKNSYVSGYAPNSVGIRAGHNGIGGNRTFNVVITSPFFEDFAKGIEVRGWGWVIDSPFVQSADVGIDLIDGGGHWIRSLVIEASTGNTVNTGLHCRSTIDGKCALSYWKSVGALPPTNAVIDDTSPTKLSVVAA